MSRILFALILTIAIPQVAFAESGMASYYGGKFHGRKTASGERFNQNASTCAHKRKPFGTWVTVTHGSRSARCRVTDRGPFVRGRIIDVSRAVAVQIGLIQRGVGRVTIR